MYKWKVSWGGGGKAYWKVLRSIKSFSRMIITRHSFKPISPDDSSPSEFLKVARSVIPPTYLFNRWPKCFACGSPPTRENAPRRREKGRLFSTLICLARPVIRALFDLICINNINFCILSVSNRYEYGKLTKKFSKNFFTRKNRYIRIYSR